MPKKIHGGFDFYRSEEQIIKFMKLPAIEKLRWLDEHRQLIFSIKDKNFHYIREALRRGEI